jgi:hypothetical protein
LFLCLIYSCVGNRCAEGIICDSKTLQSIDSVRCEVLSGKNFMLSDSTGKYSICIRVGGINPERIDIEVTFSKIGYKTKTVTNPKAGNIIYLDKE